MDELKKTADVSENEPVENPPEGQPIDEKGKPTDEGAPEKKFSQDEVDKIINKVTQKHYKKLDNYQKLSKLVAEFGGVEGETPEEQVQFLERYYQNREDGKPEPERVKKPDDTKAYVKALRFANKANDDDVYDEVQRIMSIPAKSRDDDDRAVLEAVGKRYAEIAFKKEYDEAKEAYGNDLDELLKDDNFKEFSEGNNLPLKKLVAKYSKLIGKKQQPEEAKKETPRSMGSVKNTGSAVAKEYYSPDEVDKLSAKDLDDPKIWNAVRRSMTKWK